MQLLRKATACQGVLPERNIIQSCRPNTDVFSGYQADFSHDKKKAKIIKKGRCHFTVLAASSRAKFRTNKTQSCPCCNQKMGNKAYKICLPSMIRQI